MPELSIVQSPPVGARGGTAAVATTAMTFAIGTQQYGLPVANVFDVVPIPAMLILAGAPTYLIGVLNRRGRYLPVLDGRILLGEQAPYDLDRYVIIAGRASANNAEHVTQEGEGLPRGRGTQDDNALGVTTPDPSPSSWTIAKLCFAL